jgi:transcriptional regulator with XRE-family HTH domain
MNQLRTFRQQKGFTLRSASQASGIPWQTISSWECGRSIPPLNRFSVLMRSLGATETDWLTFCAELQSVPPSATSAAVVATPRAPIPVRRRTSSRAA